MREPPKLPHATLVAALTAHYGGRFKPSAAALTFLPLGADSASAVYRVEGADGATYFLKARAGAGFSVPSLVIPRYLCDRGVPHILAAIPTAAGALWCTVGDFALSLYPFVAGRAAADVGLTDAQWRDFGATAAQIHASPLPPDVLPLLPRESFTPTRRGLIARLADAVVRSTTAAPAASDPVQREFAAFWQARQAEIAVLVERADALGAELRGWDKPSAAPLVLCHADMHTWNVLVADDGQWWLVDWDETLLALRERDLMFVIGGIGGDGIGPHQTACFLQGYGPAEINDRGLTYYRFAWAVQDIAAWGESVLFLPDLSEATRRTALRSFRGLFEPEGIVERALASARGFVEA
jgi:spectinomycin phosphotransferase